MRYGGLGGGIERPNAVRTFARPIKIIVVRDEIIVAVYARNADKAAVEAAEFLQFSSERFSVRQIVKNGLRAVCRHRRFAVRGEKGGRNSAGNRPIAARFRVQDGKAVVAVIGKEEQILRKHDFPRPRKAVFCRGGGADLIIGKRFLVGRIAADAVAVHDVNKAVVNGDCREVPRKGFQHAESA